MYTVIQESELFRLSLFKVMHFIVLSLFLFSFTLAGIPPLADHAQLELTVAYNACVASLAHSQFSEAELRLKHAMQRGRKSSAVVKASLSFALALVPCFVPFSLLTVLQNTTEEPVDSDPLVFWRTALQLVENTSLKSSVRRLLGLQWAVWLASCQMRTIQEFQVRSCLFLQ